MALGNKTLDDLLNPITKQLGNAKVADSITMPEWEFKAQRVTDGLNGSELIDLFAAEAEKIRVQVKRCAAADLATTIADIVGKGTPDEGAACSVVCARDDRFQKAGVYDTIASCDLVAKADVWDNAKADESIEAARVATYGVTYAASGIAETGTVVQPTSTDCGRAVSLLPLVHIAVVDASTIKPTMLEIMQDLGNDGSALPSQVCFISGPSATADIELVRVEGVHGPMYVNYVIVD